MKAILTILAFLLVFIIYTKSGSVYKVNQIVYEAPRGHNIFIETGNSDWIRIKLYRGGGYMYIPVANIEYIIQEKEE